MEDVASGVVMRQGKVLRVSGAEKLQRHLHNLFTGKFTAGEILKDQFAMFSVKLFSLGDALSVVTLKLKPPVCLELGEGYR